MIIEYDNMTVSNNLSQFNQKYQNMKNAMDNKIETNSLIVRDAVITGNTHTIHESMNSHGGISSFKSMNHPNKQQDNLNKRESILKFVLLQNAQQNSGSIYGNNFANEVFDSDCEGIEGN